MNKSTANRWERLRRAITEFVIIVTGVLVALGVDEWRTARQEHALELEYAIRLRSDLQQDTASFGDFERTALATKASVLLGLSQTPVMFPRTGNSDSLMQALEYSQFIALPAARSGTFREMESTGRLALLRDPEIRSGLAHYYTGHELMSGILSQPIGPYRQLVNSVLPGGAHYAWRTAGDTLASQDLDRAIQSLVSDPNFPAAVNAELSYTGSLVHYLRQSSSRAQSLLRLLDKEYAR